MKFVSIYHNGCLTIPKNIRNQLAFIDGAKIGFEIVDIPSGNALIPPTRTLVLFRPSFIDKIDFTVFLADEDCKNIILDVVHTAEKVGHVFSAAIELKKDKLKRSMPF